MPIRNSLITLLVVLLLVAAAVLHVSTSQAAVGVQVGEMAPDFRLASLTGAQLTLRSLRGRLVYLNFFASWCPPCQEETPDLVKMYARYGKRVVFVAVDLTGGDSVLDVEAFAARYRIPYPVLLDLDSKVAKRYQVVGIPTSLFINQKGVIENRVLGGMTPATMETDFSQLAGGA
ncbi:MAG: TlpA disulfide reductase family protein [Firmicutes bacterium]|nr:TlpA disulfide reductase family protein [Bacillota bacterium]